MTMTAIQTNSTTTMLLKLVDQSTQANEGGA
jgi:hypothetical protein